MDFKTIESHLHKWASKYAGYPLERWDLIDECWLCNNIHRKINPKYLSQRIHFNMIDILRKETSSRNKHKPHFISDSAFDEPIRGIMDKNLDLVDQADTFAFYTKGLSLVEKAIIYKKFCAGFTQREIAKSLGMTQGNVSYIMTNALMKMYKKGKLND